MILIIISKMPENIREGAHFQQNRRPYKSATSLKNEFDFDFPVIMKFPKLLVEFTC